MKVRARAQLCSVALKSIPAKFSASFRGLHLVVLPHTKRLALFVVFLPPAVTGFIARSSVLADKNVIALSAKVGILPNGLTV